MGYGARARRVPALGGTTLTDVDIYKIALLCKTERGIVDSGGTTLLMEQIYSMNDFYKKCGGFNSSYYGAYVAQSFFDSLLCMESLFRLAQGSCGHILDVLLQRHLLYLAFQYLLR